MANILVEKKGKIGIITVNRPEQLNSMNSATRSEMAQSFEDMETDSDVSVVILTGTPGKAFIAGADIKEFAEMDLRTREEMNEDWRVNKVISEMTKPVIAMI
ncbi:MAG TPA: enoyl-CoA hydratase/isomerase family protein, partial [Candidatus Poseidoniia archaeon]|nr:enoyl-CoA hydratase/isomerase family protein [Candidatus Poseidoniia archaeon]